MAIEYHPIFVQFPIVLVACAVVFDIGRWIFDRERLMESGFWGGTTPLLVLAFVGGILAVATGLQAEPTSDVSPVVGQLISTHETLAFVSTGLLAALVFWRLGLRGQFPKKASLIYLFGLLVLGCLLAAVGYFGGQMVFSHGVGVDAPRQVMPR